MYVIVVRARFFCQVYVSIYLCRSTTARRFMRFMQKANKNGCLIYQFLINFRAWTSETDYCSSLPQPRVCGVLFKFCLKKAAFDLARCEAPRPFLSPEFLPATKVVRLESHRNMLPSRISRGHRNMLVLRRESRPLGGRCLGWLVYRASCLPRPPGNRWGSNPPPPRPVPAGDANQNNKEKKPSSWHENSATTMKEKRFVDKTGETIMLTQTDGRVRSPRASPAAERAE